MFHAVRQWWNGGRGKTTARLFAFEFVVVVTGVLVAQGLADWVGDRAAIKRMERARDDEHRLIARASTIVAGIGRAAPCIDRRMTHLMTLVAQQEPITPDLIRRPKFYPPSLKAFPEEDLILLSDRHGEAERRSITASTYLANEIAEKLDQAAIEWSAFTQIDPASGPVSDLDRAEARKAAGRIKQLFAGIATQSDSYLGAAKLIGIAPSDDVNGMRMIQSCDDLWAAGKLLPDVEDRR